MSTTTTTTQAAVTTVAVPLFELRRALEWVIPSASSPADRSPYSVVHFLFGAPEQHTPHYDKRWDLVPATSYALSVAATDRYRLSYATISGAQVKDTNDLTSIDAGGTFVVPLKELKAAMKAWPKPKGSHEDVLIAFRNEGTQVTVTVTENGQLAQQTFLPTEDMSFPKYKGLIPPVPENRTEAPYFTLNAHFLQQMAAAATKVNGRGGVGLSFSPMDPQKAIPVRTHWDADATTHFSAIIMPIRENQ